MDDRMLRRGDRWLIYDVRVEGVSLIGNYRTQFNNVLQTSSYGELVKRMRTKAEAPKAHCKRVCCVANYDLHSTPKQGIFLLILLTV